MTIDFALYFNDFKYIYDYKYTSNLKNLIQ